MEYSYLGKTGLSVSRICLGTMTFGAQVTEADSITIIHHAIDKGVNFIDTANVYSKGRAEAIVGKALRNKRDGIVLSSKCSLAMSDAVNDGGLSRSTIVRHVNDSLKRLKTDFLDILFLHYPDEHTSIEEIVHTMSLLIRDGKIRHYGLSNFPAWQCCAIVHTARELRLPEPVVTENVYNLVTRGIDDELIPFVEEYRLGLITFNPLAGGLLTGKHSRTKTAVGSRLAIDEGYFNRYCRDGNFTALDTLIEISNSIGMAPAQLAYRWLLSKSYIASVICGVSTLSQLESNLESCDNEKARVLDSDILARCDAIWDSLKGSYFNYHA